MDIPWCLGFGIWGFMRRPDVAKPLDSATAYVSICVLALTSRIIAAFLLPTAEQDGYSYAEIIAGLTNHLETGRFRLTDLYGFWLPAFQFAAAVVNLGIHSPIVAGKVLNALCGAATVVLVFEITRLVTRSLMFALIGFVMMLLDPLHLLYSAACMTDVPHACIVLVSLWLALRQRWTGAAVFAAIAGTIRVESWALLFILPVLEFLNQRKIPWLTICILLMPPMGWLLTTYAATGHPLSYFQERRRYHSEYIQFHPDRIGFNWRTVLGDVEAWLLGAHGLVTTGVLIATAIVIWRMVRARDWFREDVAVVAAYWWGMLGLLAVAYLTKAQPVLLPRYGLMFLAIGLPVFGWTLQWCFSGLRSRSTKPVLATAVVILIAAELYSQLPTISNVQDDYRAHQKIASVVAKALLAEPGVRCFSDDAAIRVISGLPVSRFVRSPAIREEAVSGDRFLNHLQNNNIRWLIFFPTEDSLPVKFFPKMGQLPPATTAPFEFVDYASSAFGPDIWLYRVR